MYNIHNHYENIFHYLNTIVQDPRILYLSPYGSTQSENLERIANDMRHWPGRRGPLFICYDQEPLYGDFNFALLDYISDHYQGPHVLVTTEKHSDALDAIQQRYGWTTVYYFHHVFAAQDWYRGHVYDARLIAPENRHLDKHYISLNRITSDRRVYRSLLINELIKHDVLNQGYVSFSRVCPEGGAFQNHLLSAAEHGWCNLSQAQEAMANIDGVDCNFRVDHNDAEFIPNQSFVIGAEGFTQRSFCFVVTETCFWERKCHLTEKIFKPIVSKMPFILVGAAHNLAYLKSYGFKTFDAWWDESYDDITDPMERLAAIGQLLKFICQFSLSDLEKLLTEMTPVLEHNFKLFNSSEFLDSVWGELTANLQKSVSDFIPINYQIPPTDFELSFWPKN